MTPAAPSAMAGSLLCSHTSTCDIIGLVLYFQQLVVFAAAAISRLAICVLNLSETGFNRFGDNISARLT